MVSEYESYTNLANAIILRAMQDYVANAKLKKKKGTEQIIKDGYNLCGLRDFFYSEWFGILTSESVERILRLVQADDLLYLNGGSLR